MIGSYSPFCKHCLGVSQNEIGETVVFCEKRDLWRNVMLGDCFNNCEDQETIAVEFCRSGSSGQSFFFIHPSHPSFLP